MTEPVAAGPRSRVIRTSRLSLEAMHPDHADDLWRAKEASLDELMPWMFWAASNAPEAQAAFIHEAARLWDEDKQWTFAVVVDDVAVGTVSVDDVDRALEKAEIGYWLRSDLAGRRLMTEAASAVVAFAFEEVALHRLELRAASGNLASIRVAEKLGFSREGLLRHGARGATGFHDAYLYGLLASDPRPGFHL
ncbi:MAG: GNAT family N-acetyltransferase [Actinomycetota bacterium]|nr:GNAT family N-acetyltransferase [Actinomycetota bacterium]